MMTLQNVGLAEGSGELSTSVDMDGRAHKTLQRAASELSAGCLPGFAFGSRSAPLRRYPSFVSLGGDELSFWR